MRSIVHVLCLAAALAAAGDVVSPCNLWLEGAGGHDVVVHLVVAEALESGGLGR